MTTINTNSNQEINIRLATPADIENIKTLNQKWTVTSLDMAEKEYGFLYCETYHSDDLEKSILAQDIAIAYLDKTIIAYCINDNYSHLLDRYNSAIAELKSGNIIPDNAKISARTQIVVEREFQRQRIPEKMLDFLKPYLLPKFDLLFSIGRNDNPKKIAHQKAGWRVIYENELYYYCVYDLHCSGPGDT